jgi:membrane-bound metal-dependent hydrolase YbcI (DUF457 family)
VALAAKRLAPQTCLGWLLAAAVGVDLVWPILLLFGLEHVRIVPGLMPANPLDFYDYPITHSLVGGLGWAVLFAAIYFAINRDRNGAWIIGALVVSHWFLDLIVHRPDLPIYPGGPMAGLGLWRSVPGTLVAEGLVFGAGIIVYLRTTTARGMQGHIALWSFVIVSAALYLASALGPPPGNVNALAWAALAQWIVVPWGWWIDASRRTTLPTS